MTTLTISSMNHTNGTIQSNKSKNTDKVPNNKDNEQIKSVALKGLVALSSIVLAGLAIKKGVKIKDAIKNSKEIYSQLQLINGDYYVFANTVKSKANELLEIKNPIKRLAALKKVKEAQNNLILINSHKKTSRKLPREMKELPAEVERLWQEEKYLEAADVFAAEVKKLPTFKTLPNAGQTVAETIEKTFGKNATIKPHTYDLTKEADGMLIQSNYGNGWMDATVGKNNKIFTETPKAIYDTMNDAISYPKRISHFSEGLPADIRAVYKQNGLELSEGYVNGRRIVQFSITPQISMDDAQLIRKGFVIRTASNNGNLTPMQQDLIKLMEHPDKIDTEIFHKIAEMEDGKGFVNANYDLILSAIQTMAKGL